MMNASCGNITSRTESGRDGQCWELWMDNRLLVTRNVENIRNVSSILFECKMEINVSGMIGSWYDSPYYRTSLTFLAVCEHASNSFWRNATETLTESPLGIATPQVSLQKWFWGVVSEAKSCRVASASNHREQTKKTCVQTQMETSDMLT